MMCMQQIMARLHHIQGVNMRNINRLKVLVVVLVPLIVMSVYFNSGKTLKHDDQLHKNIEKIHQENDRFKKKMDEFKKITS